MMKADNRNECQFFLLRMLRQEKKIENMVQLKTISFGCTAAWTPGGVALIRKPL